MMLFRFFGAFAGLLLVTTPGLVQAGTLAEFNSAVAGAYAHYRAASTYLRTGNVALADIELEDFAARWRDVISEFGDAPPQAFSGEANWRGTLESIRQRTDNSQSALDKDDLKAAREAVLPIRKDLAALRRRNGVIVFSDCVNDISAEMDLLVPFRRNPPDFDAKGDVQEIQTRTAVLTYLFKGCRERAPDSLRSDPQFERIISGALEGLARMWRALDARDLRMLTGTISELRSFEQILFQRFG